MDGAGNMTNGNEPEPCIREEATSSLPTRFGDMQFKVYRNQQGLESMAIISGEPDTNQTVPVRVHSACLTGEVLSSMKCDCKSQLDYALQYIADKNGVVIYLPQEGRGIGLVNKIRAYSLQEQGLDTVDANRALGLPDDARSYTDAAMILNNLGIRRISLLTNNPQKVSDLTSLGIYVQDRVPLPLMANQHSIAYLKTKQARMGHLFDMTGNPESSCQAQSQPARPIVHVNFALDPQGRTAKDSGQPMELSCPRDWRRVHELREHYSAVVVGARTWQTDNPSLTARSQQLGRKPRRQPDRVIFAGQHDCEFTADERRTFVVGNGRVAPGAIQIESNDHGLTRPLQALQWHGISSMLVEGGLTLLLSFIREGTVDQLTVYVRTDARQTATSAIQIALPGFPVASLRFERFGKGILASSGRLTAGPAS
jgi:GTP cyclohydrolase II